MTLPEIIEKIKSKIHDNQYVYAMWLEGSYATGEFNEDSDIDVWMDVEDGRFKECYDDFVQALEELNVVRSKGELNYYLEDPKLAKVKIYLNDKNDNQRIELDIQEHSRRFVFSKSEHNIKVLFDKDHIIKWRG